MSNVLDDHTQQQIVALGRLGWSLRRIEAATGVRRETVSDHLKAAGVPVRGRGGRPRGWPPKPATRSEVSTDSAAIPRPGRAPSASACEPYRELIAEALGRGRNAMAIWQDLVDGHDFTARYASVRRFVRTLRRTTSAEARVVITTAAGEEAQVDYGDGPMVRHPKTGKYRRTRLFVLTLGYSRKSVRLLVWQSSAQVWAELHERAFRRLGGTTRVVVLDNLKEGVLTPDIYDPALNPLYRDVLAYYDVVALPCRVGDPDRKGKVESGIGHTQKTALQGMRFETLEEAQAYLDRWDTRWADTRIHGTTKRQVDAMFAEEQPALGPLPLEPFRYYRFGVRTVHLDGCVEVDAAYYSAPPGWIGRRVDVQWNDLHVRLLDPKIGRLLREHVRAPRGWHRIEDADLVSDELRRRQDRLLERSHKLARFRDPERSLDTFDFDFNKKTNRALVYELFTARFIAQREDVLFLGPPGTGKSHLAQAIGRAAILQGYRVVYREAHTLLEELAEATLAGARKDYLMELATVPLLIIDDLGMRKLAYTAAEDLLELIMRRYERASTLLTSNRPVDDWGKLLGDTAAVTALLDRLLHHGHVLKWGPRSWRTKVQTDLRTEEGMR
jgi:DNA replication protein DnaC/transposase